MAEEEGIYGESAAFSLLALLSLRAPLAHPPFSPLLSSLKDISDGEGAGLGGGGGKEEEEDGGAGPGGGDDEEERR